MCNSGTEPILECYAYYGTSNYSEKELHELVDNAIRLSKRIGTPITRFGYDEEPPAKPGARIISIRSAHRKIKDLYNENYRITSLELFSAPPNHVSPYSESLLYIGIHTTFFLIAFVQDEENRMKLVSENLFRDVIKPVWGEHFLCGMNAFPMIYCPPQYRNNMNGEELEKRFVFVMERDMKIQHIERFRFNGNHEIDKIIRDFSPQWKHFAGRN